MRTIIVDDEPLARDNLRIALQSESEVTVVGECGSGEEAVQAIRRLNPDLVFLDVQMPGHSGFDVIADIGVDRMPATVFVTAFDAHALQAFEVRAIDYLLKPFDDARLKEAVRRARVQRGGSDAELPTRLGELLAALRSRDLSGPHPKRLTRLIVRDADRAIPIRVDDVDWLEADGNYVKLHVNRSEYRLRVTLKALVEQLDSRRFARVHKSAILNLDRVREVQPWFSGDYVAILTSGERVRVSRTFAAAVLDPLQ